LSSAAKKLLIDSGMPFLIKVSAAIIGLIFSYTATQYLSTEEFGAFSIAMLLALVLVTLSKLGLENSVVKLVAISLSNNNKANAQKYYTLALLISMVGALLLIFLVIIFQEFIAMELLSQPKIIHLIPTIAWLILPNTMLVINSSLFKGSNRPNLSITFSGLATFSFGIMGCVLFNPINALELLKIVCIAAYIATFISFLIYFNYLRFKIDYDLAPLKKVLSSCIPLWYSSIISLVIQQGSLLLLAIYSPLQEVAIFAIASKIAITTSFLLFAVNIVVSPKFAALYSAGKIDKLKLLVSTSNKILTVMSLAVTIAVLFFAESILALFGEEFTEGAVWLKVLVVGQFVNVSAGSVVYLLIMTGHEKLHQRNIMLSAIATCIMGFTLIPIYGALGAAITTALATTIQNSISFYYAHYRILN